MSMFTMQQHAYMYSASPEPARQYSTQGTSSAFSSSAHPDEDWTKISDLAERRRIQNRIAQRNYRKKLKRRLEDLERRAGSSDDGETEKKPRAPSPSKPKRQSISKSQKPTSVKTTAAAGPGQFTPPMENNKDLMFNTPVFDGRDRSNSPPMFSTYSTYPAPDELLMDPYATAHPYPGMSAAEAYPNYLAASTMSSAIPAMNAFADAMKPVEETMNPYLNSYSFIPGVDMGMGGHYDAAAAAAAAHTPPLSHSYEQSTSCSETGFDYPTTPLSMPGSPGLAQS